MESAKSKKKNKPPSSIIKRLTDIILPDGNNSQFSSKIINLLTELQNEHDNPEYKRNQKTLKPILEDILNIISTNMATYMNEPKNTNIGLLDIALFLINPSAKNKKPDMGELLDKIAIAKAKLGTDVYENTELLKEVFDIFQNYAIRFYTDKTINFQTMFKGPLDGLLKWFTETIKLASKKTNKVAFDKKKYCESHKKDAILYNRNNDPNYKPTTISTTDLKNTEPIGISGKTCFYYNSTNNEIYFLDKDMPAEDVERDGA